VTDFYMEFWALNLANENRAAWQNEICELSASRLNEEQVVIHGDHLLRMKGELVHEFKCEWVLVTNHEGFKAEGDRCLDHLPVFTAQRQLSYLAPLTRLLVPRTAVVALNCSTNFPLTVEDTSGRMITANPAITLVDVKLSEYHLWDENHPNHSELFDVKSLLYTPEEVADYEQLLLGPGSERAVTRQFASYYCQTSGECSTSRSAQNFRWDRMLQDPSQILTGWWDTVKEWLLWWGAVWGCCDSVITILQVFAKLLTVLCRGGNANVNRGTLLRFMFMPGAELVGMFPTQREDRRTRRRVSFSGAGPSAPDDQERVELNWNSWKQ
jgi:hypothetical protein